jgi:hypothetical protein
MKLAKLTDEIIGLVVALPNGPHIVDLPNRISSTFQKVWASLRRRIRCRTVS